MLLLITERTILPILKQYIGAFAQVNIAKLFGMQFDTSLIIVPTLNSGAVAINRVAYMDVGEVIVTETPVLIATSSQTQSHQADQ